MISDICVDCVVGVNPDERVKLQRVVVALTLFVDAAECGRSDLLEHTVNYAAVAKLAARVCRETKAYTLEALAAQLARATLLSAGCERVRRVRVRLDKPDAMRLGKPAVSVEREREFFLDEERRFGKPAAPVLEAQLPPTSAAVTAPAAAAAAEAVAAVAAAAAAAAAAASAAATAAVSAGDAGAADEGELVFVALGSNVGRRAECIQLALRLLCWDGDASGGGAAASAASVAGLRAAPLAAGLFVRLVDTSFLYETPPAYVLDQPPFLNCAASLRTNLSPAQLLARIKDDVEARMGRVLDGAPGAAPRFGPRCIDVDILLVGPGRSLAVDVGSPRELIVPHPRMAERDFALGPLCDLCPGFVHASFGVSVRELLSRLPSVQLMRVTPCVVAADLAAHSGAQARAGAGAASASDAPAASSASASAAAPAAAPTGEERLLRFGGPGGERGRTLIMGVLNATPDSFSDGGECLAPEAAVARAREMVAAGVDVIDVGGQSTRPGATLLSAAEEAARVLPVLRALRAALGAACPPLSVDTFYASVARSAVLLEGGGASVVNDVSAGALDPLMLPTAAALGVPFIAMHMRGTPQTMAGLAVYAPQPPPPPPPPQGAGVGSGASAGAHAGAVRGSDAAEREGVVAAVRAELGERARAALRAGVLRWNLLLDPGLGFAKAPLHSLALLAPSARLFARPGHALAAVPAGPAQFAQNASFPTLYGASRKGFVGAAAAAPGAQPLPAAERDFATAAAVAACIAAGASLVRVHNVAALAAAVRVADAVLACEPDEGARRAAAMAPAQAQALALGGAR